MILWKNASHFDVMNICRMGIATHPETETSFESVAVFIFNNQTNSFFARGVVCFPCQKDN
jgi:hypothetical protein